MWLLFHCIISGFINGNHRSVLCIIYRTCIGVTVFVCQHSLRVTVRIRNLHGSSWNICNSFSVFGNFYRNITSHPGNVCFNLILRFYIPAFYHFHRNPDQHSVSFKRNQLYTILHKIQQPVSYNDGGSIRYPLRFIVNIRKLFAIPVCIIALVPVLIRNKLPTIHKSIYPGTSTWIGYVNSIFPASFKNTFFQIQTLSVKIEITFAYFFISLIFLQIYLQIVQLFICKTV